MTEPRYLFVSALSTLYYYCFLFSYMVLESNYWAFDFILAQVVLVVSVVIRYLLLKML